MLAEPSLRGFEPCSLLRRPTPTPQEAACPVPRHGTVIRLQCDALGSFEQFSTLAASYSESVQMKMLHSVKEHDPITMSNIRFALFELLQNYAVSIDSWLTSFIFPISN